MCGVRHDVQDEETYRDMYELESHLAWREWSDEFDISKFPFKPNGATIHEALMSKMKQRQQ